MSSDITHHAVAGQSLALIASADQTPAFFDQAIPFPAIASWRQGLTLSWYRKDMRFIKG